MDKSYIVRIYKNDSNSVIGVVEDTETHTRGKFSNPQELWNQVSIKREKLHSNVKLNVVV
ncbi:hypothetical protein [uncultured Oceanicoccus sp.]|uniref:hypothetical protein n=1 Tax=uncultured Oceanicoccus sp. TaxID=1706381 RepID=UPI0030DC7907